MSRWRRPTDTHACGIDHHEPAGARGDRLHEEPLNEAAPSQRPIVARPQEQDARTRPWRVLASPVRRWLLGAYYGAASRRHLDHYLDGYTFRLDRRTSRSRGKLFYGLVQQTVAVDPVPGRELVGGTPNV